MNPEMMGMLASYGPIILMIVVFYFMLYKPQKKEQKRRQEMLDSLKKGNRVMTIGGIYGEITAVKDDVITVNIAENVDVKVNRSCINNNLSAETAGK